MAATQMYTAIIIALTIAITFTAAAEICQWETFEAKCQDDEVILIKDASYGRMKVGRCQPRNYFIGCSADVTAIMHARCSGRQHCSIPVPDPTMFAATPCPKDLVTYLDAEYECIKVTKATTENCEDQTLTGLNGYITKPAEKTTNQKLACPQRIVAQPGQTVNIYLYDFTNKQSDIEAKFYQPKCTTYGYVSEDTTITPKRICGGTVKTNHLIYTSDSHVVEVALMEPSTPTHHYLLRYQVIGCPTLQAPENSQLNIEEDTAIITCDYSSTVVTLVCSDNQWVGDLQNCTGADLPIADSMSGKSLKNIFANSSVFVIVCVGLVLGVVFGVGLLGLVMNYFISRRTKDQKLADFHQTSTLLQKPTAFKTDIPSEKSAISAIDQYQPVYVPITLNQHGQYVPVHQSAPRALSTFQSRVNMPTLADYATTLEARIASNENSYGRVSSMPVHDCGHTIYDLAALSQTLGRDKIITMDEASLI